MLLFRVFGVMFVGAEILLEMSRGVIITRESELVEKIIALIEKVWDGLVETVFPEKKVKKNQHIVSIVLKY